MTEDQMAQIGDYVLGLLDGPELQAFEAQMRQDPALAQSVSIFAGQLQSLDDTALPLTPNPELWGRIEQDLQQAEPGTASIIAMRRRPAMPAQWMGLAASVALALGIGYFAGTLGTGGTRQPVMVAVLLDTGNAGPGAIVEAFADDTIRLVPLESFALGVPCLVGPSSHMFRSHDLLREALVVKHPHSPFEIAEKITWALAHQAELFEAYLSYYEDEKRMAKEGVLQLVS